MGVGIGGGGGKGKTSGRADRDQQGSLSTGGSSLGGGKPGEDRMAQAGANPQHLTELGKNLVEAARQRKLLSGPLDVAQTIMGLMPAPGLGPALGLGRWMGRKVEEDALANPEKYRNIPGDPGGVMSVGPGPKNANRADYPGHNSSPGNRTNGGPDDTINPKKKPLPTLLGAIAGPLGTPNNPVKIL